MSIVFKQITLQNFLSYGKKPTTLKLDRPGRTTFIIGKDLDNVSAGTAGNGCGKTAVLNALVFALYDKPLSNISKESLVNNVNRKDMEVTVEFEKEGKPYAIRRIRKGKAGASVYLYEGADKKDITPDSIKFANQKIAEIIGFPYELFVRVVAYSATNKSFLELPTSSKQYANQRDIVEELFELKVLTERAEELSGWIREAKKEFKMQQSHVDQLKGEHERHKKLVASTKTRIKEWEQDTTNETKTIQQKLAKIEGIDIDKEHRLHEVLDTYTADLKEKQLEQRSVERAISTNVKERKKQEGELEQLREAKCPYCKQAYHDNEMKILEVEAALSDLTAEMTKFEDQLMRTDEAVEKLEALQTETAAKIEVSNIKELMAIRGKQDQYKDRLKHLAGGTNPHIAALEELEKVKLEEIDTDQLDEMETEIRHQEFLLKGLTKNDSYMRKKLLNKKIPYLNKRLAKYLGIVGLPHSVRFTEEMTVKISRFGRTLDFGNLSNGQQARLNFALSLSFKDMLESIHGDINIFMLDEVLDIGLDAVGVQAASKHLKNMARDKNKSIYIISHKEELSNAFDKKMKVVMSKGFSHIEENDEQLLQPDSTTNS